MFKFAVQAGSANDGVGIVKTGPFDGGVAASLLAAGKPASRLVGRLGGK
jgi:hypothetical protein